MIRQRKPLQRSTRLSRSPLKRKPRRPRPAGHADARYLEWIRKQPCCAPLPPGCPCYGPIEAHHITGAGMGKKARDDETMPLCGGHHDDLHEFKGPFAGWTRQRRRKWQLARIRDTQALYRVKP